MMVIPYSAYFILDVVGPDFPAELFLFLSVN